MYGGGVRRSQAHTAAQIFTFSPMHGLPAGLRLDRGLSRVGRVPTNQQLDWHKRIDLLLLLLCSQMELFTCTYDNLQTP